MMFYETNQMSKAQANQFARQFDRQVGTEREINEIDDFSAYVVCMELEGDEVETCRRIEREITRA